MGQRAASETLQHSLLPERLPELPGVELAARYVPGGPGVDVGGDWYDVLMLPDGSVGLAMGDVVGRGISAASLMGQLRNALRAYALEGYSPGRVLERLNALLDGLGGGEQMATLLYGTFDLQTGEVCLANAGHPPPAWTRGDGTVEFVEGASGVPLGALGHAQYPEQCFFLEPGASLLLYTDGLVESREMPLGVGLRRLHDALSDAPDDAEALCARALAVLEGDEGGNDDVALLALRSVPLGDRLDLSLPADPLILRPLRSTLRRWLREVGASDEETLAILVATGEACANVIRHASAERFQLAAVRNGDIRVEVRDRGRWRESSARGSGGRGLNIMEELMDEVEVRRGPPETVVSMRHGVSASGSREAG
jgi:anti-sigma regulatory factor (Ser/Thr protein kinase)